MRALILYTQTERFVKMECFTIFLSQNCKNERKCKKTEIFKKSIDKRKAMCYNNRRKKCKLRKKADSVLTIPQGCVWFIVSSRFQKREFLCVRFLHALFLFFMEVQSH